MQTTNRPANKLKCFDAVCLCHGVFNTIIYQAQKQYIQNSLKRPHITRVISLRTCKLFFFFLISKNVIYTNGYSMHKEHRANPENTRRKKQKRKPIHRLITKRKRAKERRERITSRESQSSRPIKKSPTKRSKHLITETIQILKSPPIPFLPNTPKDAQRN